MPLVAALAAALGLGIPGQASATFYTINFNGDNLLQLDGTDDLNWSLCGTTTINPQPGCDGIFPTPPTANGLADGKVGAVDIFSITAADIDTTFESVNFGTQDVLFFEVELNNPSAPVDQIGASVGTVSGTVDPLGVGYLNAPGETPDPVNGMSIESSFGFPPGGTGLFDYDHNGLSAGNLEAGETTRILFITYASGELAEGQTASFMISTGTDQNFTVTIVPEPSTALLLAAGLAAMGAVCRRRRGR